MGIRDTWEEAKREALTLPRDQAIIQAFKNGFYCGASVGFFVSATYILVRRLFMSE
ncbi:MAG: hypothetical protein AAF539_08195 [Planctomycetota bacterium]